MKQIVENVYGILTKFSFVNYYLLANGDDLTLIDIGLNNADVDRLEQELASHDWNLDQIHNVLITHAHPDHIGGLAELQKRTSVKTFVHTLDAPITRGEQAPPSANPDELTGFWRIMGRSVINSSPPPPAQVDIELKDGDSLDALYPGLEVVHLPGHSYGQVGYWLPEKRLLIGGDVMMRMPWGLIKPLRPVSPDWNAVKDSIRKVADMNVNILCLGHGTPIIGEAHHQIQALTTRL